MTVEQREKAVKDLLSTDTSFEFRYDYYDSKEHGLDTYKIIVNAYGINFYFYRTPTPDDIRVEQGIEIDNYVIDEILNQFKIKIAEVKNEFKKLKNEADKLEIDTTDLKEAITELKTPFVLDKNLVFRREKFYQKSDFEYLVMPHIREIEQLYNNYRNIKLIALKSILQRLEQVEENPITSTKNGSPQQQTAPQNTEADAEATGTDADKLTHDERGLICFYNKWRVTSTNCENIFIEKKLITKEYGTGKVAEKGYNKAKNKRLNFETVTKANNQKVRFKNIEPYILDKYKDEFKNDFEKLKSIIKELENK